jgi:hypothetical protein
LAGHTIAPNTNPNISTMMNRLRPLTFLPGSPKKERMNEQAKKRCNDE